MHASGSFAKGAQSRRPTYFTAGTNVELHQNLEVSKLIIQPFFAINTYNKSLSITGAVRPSAAPRMIFFASPEG